MVILARTRYPSGGSYADRVHLYIAPGVVSSLGVGRGPFHNLGRDRRPHFRSYVGARAAFRRAGGVWLEMYHFDRATRTRYPFNTYEWAVYPWRFAQYMSGPRATRPTAVTLRHLHFMMTRGMPTAKGGAPAACLGAAAPMDCQFTLASSAKNVAILGNGVGAYRMEGQEAAWRLWVRRLFFT